MNIELARTFLEVVQAGSLARGADRIHVTHSTVTMRIKLLESVLGRKLLVRSKAGVTMTPAGNRFYKHAETLVHTWQVTKRQMSLAPGFDGNLSVGAEEFLWDDLMFDWVCNTRVSKPNVAIRCESAPPDNLLQRLFQGWLDFCVVYATQAHKGFTVEKLFDDPLVLVSTVSRVVIDHWDPEFIEIDWDAGYRALMEKDWGHLDETPHLSSASPALGLRFVMQFGGSTWIPKRVLERREFSRELHPVRGSPPIERTAYLAYSQENLKEKLPGITIDDIRASLLRQLEGRRDIWELSAKPRGPKVKSQARK